MASAIVSVSSSVSSRSVHPFVIFMLTTCAPTSLRIRDITTPASTCSFINRCSNGLWPIPFWRTSVASSSCDLHMQHGYASSAAAIIHELSMNSSGPYNEFLLLHDCPLHTTNCSPEPTIWLVVADAVLESCAKPKWTVVPGFVDAAAAAAAAATAVADATAPVPSRMWANSSKKRGTIRAWFFSFTLTTYWKVSVTILSLLPLLLIVLSCFVFI